MKLCLFCYSQDTILISLYILIYSMSFFKDVIVNISRSKFISSLIYIKGKIQVNNLFWYLAPDFLKFKQLYVKMKVAQLCPTLSNPMDYTVHEILQARILERVAFPSSRGSSQPRYWIQVSCIAGGFFTSWATMEAQEYRNGAQTEVSGKSLYKLKLISIHIGISVLQ